ncbi:hypothetical protein BVC80_9083g36 [Macleaya cordata]|uniref:Uncharacterized protein n=1 Tax=Macleaya cordata TaxID=56857 RepID=A0A200PRF0_MACCD|nr:hypothetical protein BVC80_9083g36 [Macleaya cordata]
MSLLFHFFITFDAGPGTRNPPKCGPDWQCKKKKMVDSSTWGDLRRSPFPSAIWVANLGHGPSSSSIDPVQGFGCLDPKFGSSLNPAGGCFEPCRAR